MTELLDEASDALRAEPVPGDPAEVTLLRIQRTLAASAGASRLALAQADEEGHGGDPLLDAAATALRDETVGGQGADATLARIRREHRTLAASQPARELDQAGAPDDGPLLDAAVSALRDETGARASASTADATLARIQRTLAASTLRDELTDELSDELSDELNDGDPLLDAAVSALRDEAVGALGADATLARVRREHRIREAVAAERVERAADALAGEPHNPADGAGTERRVLATLAGRRARSRWAMAAAAILAVLVGAPTTWALTTGRLQRWLAFDEVERTERAPASEPTPPPQPVAARARAVSAVATAEPIAAEEALVADLALERDPRPEPSRPEPSRPEPTRPEPSRPEPSRPEPSRPEPSRTDRPAETAPSPRPRARAERASRVPVSIGPDTQPAERVEVAEPSPEARERALFQAAHRQHFGGVASDSTLAAWDAYLSAHPSGRYAPEARYNRALTLIRLGQRGEARRALATFANAPEGSFRREEARALLEALDAP